MHYDKHRKSFVNHRLQPTSEVGTGGLVGWLAGWLVNPHWPFIEQIKLIKNAIIVIKKKIKPLRSSRKGGSTGCNLHSNHAPIHSHSSLERSITNSKPNLNFLLSK